MISFLKIDIKNDIFLKNTIESIYLKTKMIIKTFKHQKNNTNIF